MANTSTALGLSNTDVDFIGGYIHFTGTHMSPIGDVKDDGLRDLLVVTHGGDLFVVALTGSPCGPPSDPPMGVLAGSRVHPMASYPRSPADPPENLHLSQAAAGRGAHPCADCSDTG